MCDVKKKVKVVYIYSGKWCLQKGDYWFNRWTVEERCECYGENVRMRNKETRSLKGQRFNNG